MATTLIVSPERLKEIVEAFRKIGDPAQIADYRKTLSPEEVEALDSYIQQLMSAVLRPALPPAPPPPTPAPPPAKPPPPTPAPPKQPTIKPDLIIKRTHYPKWWNDEGVAKISLTSPGSQMVITARGDYSLFIGAIIISCNGECDISFTFGSAGSSGVMHFGGSDEPRAMVIAMGNSPAPCGSGTFMVTASSTDPVSIGGFVSYFLWKKDARVE